MRADICATVRIVSHMVAKRGDLMAVKVLKLASLRVFSKHPVLDQFASDMVSGIDPRNLPTKRINLYIGVHRSYGLALFRRGVRIGVQTEHYFDENGTVMWARHSRAAAIKNLILYHRILDLSPANHKFYQRLPGFLRRRVIYGPYIFPCHPVEHQPGTGSFVFYGGQNDRRDRALSSLPDGYCKALFKVYGAPLSTEISKSKGVVNIHITDGIYTEYPRLLSAYIHGKPLISEALSSDLVAGVDYGEIGKPYSPCDLRNIFTDFRESYALRYRLTDFLGSI